MAFEKINPAYDQVFQFGKLSLGLVVPIERSSVGELPSMKRHVERAQKAEALGFSSLWLRDVPFNVPSFGDAGHLYDPFVYLGFLAAHTRSIALGTASIVLPLRHPAHVAKSAASVDQLSEGRLIMGIASGDRPEEYPAMNMTYEDRGERFRADYEYIRKMKESFPNFQNERGQVQYMDMVPKPFGDRIPMLVTGSSRQRPDWIFANSDGCLTYPRGIEAQKRFVENYREGSRALGRGEFPVAQSLYVDVTATDEPATPIHLGFRSGTTALLHYLRQIEAAGINHVALNLRFNQADIEYTLEKIADEVITQF